MDDVRFDILNTEVQMTMVVKLHQLQRESLPHLSYRNLEDYLTERVWKKGNPKSLHVAVNDIMSVSASDIVKFLSRQAIQSGSQKSLEDFADLIGGEALHGN